MKGTPTSIQMIIKSNTKFEPFDMSDFKGLIYDSQDKIKYTPDELNEIKKDIDENISSLDDYEIPIDWNSSDGDIDILGDIVIADKIIKIAQYYAPVKTGYMRRNIKRKFEEGHVCIVSEAPYSIYVHEILENRHAFPTKAKFLEDAAIEVKTELGNFDVSIEYTPVLRVWINYPDRGTVL